MEEQSLFAINENSGVDKYRQIVNGIIAAIKKGTLHRDDVLPSVSQICDSFGLSKETVLKAYAMLQQRGIVTAVARKGYYVATESVNHFSRIMLLFDELTQYKQVMYDQFMRTIDGKVKVDIFFHHCIPSQFETLLLDKIKYYDQVIVMPFANEQVMRTIQRIDDDKILLIDRRDNIEKACSHVIQEFRESVYNCLIAADDLLHKYHTLYLIFPKNEALAIKSSHAPREIQQGFDKYCLERGLNHHIVHNADEINYEPGTAVMLIDDLDLVAVVETARQLCLSVGSQIGIISYNDTPMKRIVENGITVISTDFAEIGRIAAELILTGKNEKITVPTRLIRRNSL